jgi:PEP-CTERM motif
MKKLGFFACLSLLCLLTIAGPGRAFADPVTVTFTGTGGQQADGAYVYPYNLTVNGSTNSLMCLSFNNEISTGESWQATIQSVIGNTLEEEAAWLLNDANVNPGNTVNDQLAAWGLFASGVAGSDNAQLLAAENFVSANPNDTSFYSQFQLYVPVNGTQTSGGDPQTFLGETPEPSSLLLLGTGLFGLAMVIFRKAKPSRMTVNL